jgi:crossover junction endodeoxyribonuclease RusA
LEPDFPIEFLVHGRPASTQTKRHATRAAWRERVKAASRGVVATDHWAATGRIAVTLFYFPDGDMQGDIDNIAKPVLDALGRHIYLDDSQVERVVVQKFEPDRTFRFGDPSRTLAAAVDGARPVLYVRLSDNPFEDLT